MPIYIYEPDAFEKLVQVEGEVWRAMHDEGLFGPSSFSAFLEAWTTHYKPLLSRHSKEQLADLGVSVDIAGSIYGHHGWTRYTVRGDGEIMFIWRQSPSEELTQKALEVGFRLFPDALAPRKREETI